MALFILHSSNQLYFGQYVCTNPLQPLSGTSTTDDEEEGESSMGGSTESSMNEESK